MPDVTIHLGGYLTPFSVIVEPWACDFKINPSEQYKVIVSNPKASPRISMAVENNALIIFVDDAGSTFRFMRGEIEELTMPIATIAIPPRRSTEG